MSGLRILPLTIVLGMVVSSTITGCREEDPVRTVSNPGKLPTMVTLDVDTYISDSGYVKYHAMTDIWEMYDNIDTPYWRFPHPLIIDIYRPGMQPGAHIECDSALYLTQRRLFRFDGNVAAVNVDKDTFLTQQLYWDQNTHTFYTDSFLYIVKGNRTVEGYGFRSNEKMTQYVIRRPSAIIPASEMDRNTRRGGTTATTDSNANLNFTDDGAFLPTPSPASRNVQTVNTVQPIANPADTTKPAENPPAK